MTAAERIREAAIYSKSLNDGFFQISPSLQDAVVSYISAMECFGEVNELQHKTFWLFVAEAMESENA